MKPTRTLLRAMLGLLLALASVPGAAACLRSCSTQAASLECLRLCSRSHALLTQDGALDSIAANDCGVGLVDSVTLASVSAFELGAPALLAMPLVALSPLAAPALPRSAVASRGPPWPSSTLTYQIPPANAPPSFC